MLHPVVILDNNLQRIFRYSIFIHHDNIIVNGSETKVRIMVKKIKFFHFVVTVKKIIV